VITTINVSPIVIDNGGRCELTVKVTYQSDDFSEMQRLEKEIKEKIRAVRITNVKGEL